MANNLVEWLLALVGNKPSGAETQHDYPVYTKHPSGLSGVERYVAQQAAIAEQKAAQAGVTGVERYVAQQAAIAEQKTAEATAATGVAKYLAQQGATSAEASAATGVAKYLAQQGPTAAANEAVAPQKKTTAARKPKSVVEPVKKQSKPVEKAIPKPGGTVKLSENATQCQAATTKGTQCSRTYSLTSIQRTINKQKYQFAVCNQHKDESFKPYPGLIGNK